MIRIFGPAIFSEEDVAHLPGHIERREKSPDRKEDERNARYWPGRCAVQDLVLTPKPGEEGHPCQRHHADGIGRESDRSVSSQSAHARNVLLLVAGMNHRSCAQEEQRLEEGMG